MPTRKIDDNGEFQKFVPCFDSDHNPPSHMVFEPGTYEHVCSACGKKTVFTVTRVYLGHSLP